VNDFIADLETELVAAARRRGTRRHRLPRPRLTALAAAAAVVLLVLAAVAAVRALDDSRSADERPAPPPGQGVVVTLPGALDRAAAGGCASTDWRGYAPGGDPQLSIFNLPQAAHDPLPGGYAWLPAAIVDPNSSRLVGPELRLVAAADLGRGCRRVPSDGPAGVCLVSGNRGDAVGRCFADTAIAAGTAVMLTRPGVVDGIVSDGVASVTVSWKGHAASAPVARNAFEAPMAGVAPGDTVHLDLSFR
jgi:hypothetical protein